MNSNKIKVATLFSGYDSQCMAFEKLNVAYDLIFWSENNGTAIKAHDAVYPQYRSRNIGDVTKADCSSLQTPDILTYSSPCQSFSRTGNRTGGKQGSGSKSSVMWSVAQYIAQLRPRYLIMENVENLANEFCQEVVRWTRQLMEFGYTSHMFVLNAADFGVPQARKRMFVVSILNSEDGKTEDYIPPKSNFAYPRVDGFLTDSKVNEQYYLDNEEVCKFLDCTNAPNLPKNKGNYVSHIPTPTCGNPDSPLAPTLKATTINNGSYRYYVDTGYFPQNGVLEVWDADDGIQRHYDIGEKFLKVSNQSKSKIIEIVKSLQPGQYLRLRSITVVEALRLMGVPKAYISKMLKADLTNEELFRLAGNSIVVDVFAAVLGQLQIINKNSN